jgi:hypothetical protein
MGWQGDEGEGGKQWRLAVSGDDVSFSTPSRFDAAEKRGQ